MASESRAARSDIPNDISRPPTASTALWSHLLRTSTTNQVPKSLKDVPIIVPSMAPLDKNATSMRVLLHDTQANFEKFTTHVGRLLENIQEMRTGLKTMQSCFQNDRETLMGDIVDLVNRSQREIQKSIGSPAQVNEVVALFKEVNHRMESLDQRLDAINAFNQTHSQTLQTQMQSIQLVLDKQGSIISAVTPLLPLLQGLPPHIESAKIAIKEEIGNWSTTHKNLSLAPCLTGLPQASTNKTTKKRKRSLGSQDTAPSSSSAGFSVVNLSPTQKRTRTLETTDNLPSANKTAKNQAYNPNVASGPSPSTRKTPAVSSGNKLVSLLKGTPRTERLTTPPLPLSDLPGLFLAPSSSLRPPIAHLASRPSSRTPPIFTHSFASTPSVPAIPNRSTTFSNNSELIQQSNKMTLSASFAGTRPSHVPPAFAFDSGSKSIRSSSRGRGPLSSPHVGQSKFTSEAKAAAKNSADATRPTGSKRTPAISRIANPNTRAKTPLSQAFVPQQASNDNVDLLRGSNSKFAFPPSATSKTKGMSAHVKERRSPVKEGRRFIPIMDSDDEENP